jgi:hypothetical protein
MSKQKENKKMLGYRIAAMVMAALMVLGSVAGILMYVLN